MKNQKKEYYNIEALLNDKNTCYDIKISARSRDKKKLYSAQGIERLFIKNWGYMA